MAGCRDGLTSRVSTAHQLQVIPKQTFWWAVPTLLGSQGGEDFIERAEVV